MAVQHYTASILNVLLDVFSGSGPDVVRHGHYQKPVIDLNKLYSDVLKNSPQPAKANQFQQPNTYKRGRRNYKRINQRMFPTDSRVPADNRQTAQSGDNQWTGWTGSNTAGVGQSV